MSAVGDVMRTRIDELDDVLDDYVERDHGSHRLVADGFDPAFVERVLRLVDLAEYKRRQFPPGPKLSMRNFGRDRRLPITNAWRERVDGPRAGAPHGSERGTRRGGRGSGRVKHDSKFFQSPTDRTLQATITTTSRLVRRSNTVGCSDMIRSRVLASRHTLFRLTGHVRSKSRSDFDLT